MKRLLLFLLVANSVFAFECASNDSSDLLESVRLDLVNHNDSFSNYSYFKLMVDNCSDDFVNGSLKVKLFETSPGGLLVFFLKNESSASFFGESNFYDYDFYFTESERFLLSEVLLDLIFDYDLTGFNRDFWVYFNFTDCEASQKLFEDLTGSKYFMNDSSSCTGYLNVNSASLRNVSNGFFTRADFFGDELFFEYEGVASINLNVGGLAREIKGCSRVDDNFSFSGCEYSYSANNFFYFNFSKSMGTYDLGLIAYCSSSNCVLESTINSFNGSPGLHVFSAQNEAATFLKELLGVDVFLDFDVNQSFSSSKSVKAVNSFSGFEVNKSFFEGFNFSESETSLVYSSDCSEIVFVKNYLFIFNDSYAVKIFDDGIVVKFFSQESNVTGVASEYLSGMISVPESLWVQSLKVVPALIFPSHFFHVDFLPVLVVAGSDKGVNESSSIILVGLILSFFLILHFRTGAWKRLNKH